MITEIRVRHQSRMYQIEYAKHVTPSLALILWNYKSLINSKRHVF
jgi:hypothetical protein